VRLFILALDKLEGDPEQEQAADDSKERNAQEFRNEEGENDAKADRRARAEHDAELALVLRKRATGHGDNNRIIAGEKDIDPNDLKERNEKGCR
jgi:hypothetical protein